MSIETEFESTITNVKNAYQGLDNLGATIPQNKTIENIKSCLSEIYSNLPKTSYAEGSNITLSNTLKGKLDFEDGIVGYGDTSQKSYQGYQMIHQASFGTFTDSGITFTQLADGGIKLNGTATANTDVNILTGTKSVASNSNNITLQANQEYTMSCNGTTSSIRLSIHTSSYTNLHTVTGNVIKFTETSNVVITAVRIIVLSGEVINNLIVYPMLEKGSNAHNYEPYVGNSPSPNPSYPQDIEVVRGKNRLKPITIDRTIKGVKITSNDNGKITIKGTATDSINEPIWGSWGGSNVLCELPQGSYVSSGLGTNSPRINIVANGTTTIFTGNSTRTLTNTAKITGIFLYINNGESVDMTFEPMIEPGSQSTPYLPYNTLEIEERGKNIAYDSVYLNQTTKYGTIARCSHTLKEGKLYTVSFDTDNSGLQIYRQSPSISGFNNASAYNFTCDGTRKSFTATGIGGTYTNIALILRLSDTSDTPCSISNLMISELEDTTYEPYQTPQTYQLSLGDKELYTDSEIVRVSKNNFKFVDKFEKKRITGVPSTINTSSTNTTRITYTTGMNSNCILSNRAKCNRLKYATIWSTDEEGFYNDNNSKNVIMRMNKSVIGETNESVSAYLEANETYILGELVTPIETPITDTTLINQLENFYNSHSFTGTTIIEIDGQLPLIIKVRALKGE